MHVDSRKNIPKTVQSSLQLFRGMGGIGALRRGGARGPCPPPKNG